MAKVTYDPQRRFAWLEAENVCISLRNIPSWKWQRVIYDRLYNLNYRAGARFAWKQDGSRYVADFIIKTNLSDRHVVAGAEQMTDAH